MFDFRRKDGFYNLTGDFYSLSGLNLFLEADNKLIEVKYSLDSRCHFPNSVLTAGLKIGKVHNQLTMSLELKNEGNKDISLDKCYFIRNAAVRLGEEAVAILQRGECAGNKNIYLKDMDEKDESTIYTVLHRDGFGGFSCGFLTFDRLFCKVKYEKSDICETALVSSLDNSASSGMRMSVYCDFNGFALQPGCEIESETFFIEENGDSYELLHSFAETVSEKYKIEHSSNPPIGWIGGWNFRDAFTKENHEKLIMQNAKAIAERLKGFGVEYIWISTCNTKDNLPGNWDKDNVYNFPNGLEYLSRYLKERGLKTGLWIAPFWMNEAADNLHLVDNAIAVKDGEKVITKTGRITHQPFNGKKPEELPRVYYLDPTHPDLHKFLKKIFTYYNDIGIRYYMVDFLTHGIDPEYNLYDKTLVNGPESYRSSMKVIHDTVTEDTYLLSSSGPTYYNIGLVDGVRAARDFGEGRPVTKYCGYYPANYLTNNFELIKEVARDYSITHPNNRRLYINDAFNMITIGKPVSKNEARIVCSLFGLSGNPVMLGDDIPSISDERLAMIKKVLPLNNRGMVPCDLFESCWPDAPHVYRMDVKKHYDEFTVMALFNFNNKSMIKKLDTQELFGDDSEYLVYDFWNEHCLGKIKGKTTVSVTQHDVSVLRFTKARSYPWVIGSDMHLSQGDVELMHLRWDPEEMTLKGSCNRPEGETGRLFIHIPAGYEPVDFRELFIIREETLDLGPDDNKLIIGMKSLFFDVETIDFSIAFRLSN